MLINNFMQCVEFSKGKGVHSTKDCEDGLDRKGEDKVGGFGSVASAKMRPANNCQGLSLTAKPEVSNGLFSPRNHSYWFQHLQRQLMAVPRPLSKV